MGLMTWIDSWTGIGICAKFPTLAFWGVLMLDQVSAFQLLMEHCLWPLVLLLSPHALVPLAGAERNSSAQPSNATFWPHVRATCQYLLPRSRRQSCMDPPQHGHSFHSPFLGSLRVAPTPPLEHTLHLPHCVGPP